MRVLLVSANREQIPDPIFPLGLAYVAAAVRNAGHQVKIADLCFGRHPLRDLREQVAVFRPEVIGLSLRNVDNAAYPLTVDYLSSHREVVDSLHQVSRAPVVLGGSGFSILPEAYMDIFNADWGIPGEGEDVVDELQALQHDYGPHPVFFVDSIANFPHRHIEAICEEILKRDLQVVWSCYATPVKLDRNQAGLMARAGCESIELGSDAVDDVQLKQLGKSFDAETVERANRYCLDAGMKVCQTVIFGAPGETEFSVRSTCRALRRMNPTAVVAMTGVRLYPGTPLTRSLISQGHVKAKDIGLLPAFYIDPAVTDFLPGFLQQQAHAAGNWVLPGLVPPLLPASQRILRGLGVSGPLWRLLRKPWMHYLNRGKFRRPNTSWGVPTRKSKVFQHHASTSRKP